MTDFKSKRCQTFLNLKDRVQYIFKEFRYFLFGFMLLIWSVNVPLHTFNLRQNILNNKAKTFELQMIVWLSFEGSVNSSTKCQWFRSHKSRAIKKKRFFQRSKGASSSSILSQSSSKKSKSRAQKCPKIKIQKHECGRSAAKNLKRRNRGFDVESIKNGG